jgi:hypothetical protein
MPLFLFAGLRGAIQIHHQIRLRICVMVQNPVTPTKTNGRFLPPVLF